MMRVTMFRIFGVIVLILIFPVVLMFEVYKYIDEYKFSVILKANWYGWKKTYWMVKDVNSKR